MASVFTRRIGRRHYVYVKQRGPDGRWRQKVVGSYRKATEARDAVRRELVRLERGEEPPPRSLTLERWVEEYLGAQRGRLRAKTIADYAQVLRRYALPHLGQVRLADLRRTHVQGWISTLQEAGVPASQIAKAYRTLRAVLAEARRQGLLLHNPASALRHPKAPPFRTKGIWGPSELARFLRAAEASPHYALWRLLAVTGMRLGEALGLRWGAVDLEAGRLQVTRTLVEVGGRLVPSEPKTARGRRGVVLDPETVEALRAHRAAQGVRALDPEADWVFSDPLGRPLHPAWVRRELRRLAEAAGVPHTSPHGLRHTAATVALAAGRPPAEVAAAMGHDVVTLLRIYSHVLDHGAGAER